MTLPARTATPRAVPSRTHTTEPAADTSHGRLLITPSTHLEATGDEA